MKHLKYYKSFNEEAEFDVQVTDKPDVKAAKEELSDLKNYLSEYKSKKTAIDNLFLKAKTDEDLKFQIDNIVGKENKNPFIVDYLHVATLKRKLDNTQKDISSDKLKKDDFNQDLKLSTDDNIKKAITAKITDITNRISTKSAEITSLNKDISDAQSSLNKKMLDTEKNMMSNIKKISNM
jgi:hypothetical protein